MLLSSYFIVCTQGQALLMVIFTMFVMQLRLEVQLTWVPLLPKSLTLTSPSGCGPCYLEDAQSCHSLISYRSEARRPAQWPGLGLSRTSLVWITLCKPRSWLLSHRNTMAGFRKLHQGTTGATVLPAGAHLLEAGACRAEGRQGSRLPWHTKAFAGAWEERVPGKPRCLEYRRWTLVPTGRKEGPQLLCSHEMHDVCSGSRTSHFAYLDGTKHMHILPDRCLPADGDLVEEAGRQCVCICICILQSRGSILFCKTGVDRPLYRHR